MDADPQTAEQAPAGNRPTGRTARRNPPRLARTIPLLAVLLLSACDRARPSSASTPPAASPDLSPRSPLELVREARGHRMAGRLDLMGECVVPEQREPVVELVRSVDALVSADEALQHSLREGFGGGVAATFKRPGVANIIGVFSRDVDVISEQLHGDTAEVAVQIAGRIPLEYVLVERRDGRWLMKTDPPIPGLPEHLADLARVLSSLSREIFNRHYTLERFEEEYRLRTTGVLRKIKALTEKQ